MHHLEGSCKKYIECKILARITLTVARSSFLRTSVLVALEPFGNYKNSLAVRLTKKRTFIGTESAK